MKKEYYSLYFCLLLILFSLVNIPTHYVEAMRSRVVSCISPSFQLAGMFRSFLLQTAMTTPLSYKEEKEELLLENYALKAQLDAVYEWLIFDGRIEEQTERIHSLESKAGTDSEVYWRDFFQRRSEELRNLIEMKTQAVPAKVIYREPSSWNSSLWIDVGEEDNELLGRSIITKNSPVVVGNALVGVVEFVDRKKSRVRLLTDSGLVPSVRAVRGKAQDKELIDLIDALLLRVKAREEMLETAMHLQKVKERLLESEKDLCLAKGELHGSSAPIWRAKGDCLKGIGFNYDYPDADGPAQDLRAEEALLKKGDLLITTGMDGVFPSGLHVAVVTQIDPLQEGDYAYQLEAAPVVSLQNLKSLFVIPKMSF